MKLGDTLEKHVQFVYTSLLNMKDEGIVVGNKVSMKGRRGDVHEIDVFYEFTKAGIKHRVAIECKEWGKPINMDAVRSFVYKIDDIGGIVGVIISENGFQSGAEELAKKSGVMLMKTADLPSFGQLLAERLSTTGLPTEDYIGEPFWTIMECQDGNVTGSHYEMSLGTLPAKFIGLMYSKKTAERTLEVLKLDRNKFCVRGLPQYAFRFILIVMELYEKRQNCGGACICYFDPGATLPRAKIISRAELMRDYYMGEPIKDCLPT